MRTMKKGLSWLLMLSMLLSLFAGLTFAASFDPANTTPEPTPVEAFDFDPDDGSIGLTKSGESLSQVVIPAKIDGVEVTSINDGMFYMNSKVEEIVIPSTVSDIGYGAFDGCDSLREIYFYGVAPYGLASTTEDDFSSATIYCKGVNYSSFNDEDITVTLKIKNDLADPAYPTSGGEDKPDQPTEPVHKFSFELRDGEAWITGYQAGSTGGEVTLPTTAEIDGQTYNVVGVAAYAFNTTNGSVDGVKDGAAIAKITKITVPMGVKTIETGAFNAMGTVNEGKNVEQIIFEDPDTTFAHEGTAQSFHLSSNPELKSVTLPANLTEITSSMFLNCTALTEMDIPETVTKISQNAFAGCTGLTRLTFTSTTPAELEPYEKSSMSTTYPFEGCTNLTIYVPAAYLEAYQTAWAAIANDVTIVGYGEGGEDPVIGAIPDFTQDSRSSMLPKTPVC